MILTHNGLQGSEALEEENPEEANEEASLEALLDQLDELGQDLSVMKAERVELEG